MGEARGLKELDSEQKSEGRREGPVRGSIRPSRGPLQHLSARSPEASVRRPTRAVVGEPDSRLGAPFGPCGGNEAGRVVPVDARAGGGWRRAARWLEPVAGMPEGPLTCP